MNAADFNELSDAEKTHFYQCKQCGEMVDMRQLDDVLFHEDHVQRRIFNTAARNGSENHQTNESAAPLRNSPP
jgi:hypothetical protein